MSQNIFIIFISIQIKYLITINKYKRSEFKFNIEEFMIYDKVKHNGFNNILNMQKDFKHTCIRSQFIIITIINYVFSITVSIAIDYCLFFIIILCFFLCYFII